MDSAELVVVNTEGDIEVKDDYNNDREEINTALVALMTLQAEGPVSLILQHFGLVCFLKLMEFKGFFHHLSSFFYKWVLSFLMNRE